ncbi:MAG: hypothetical protein PF503_00320, partial [Desulfobacula sp.]|nr:hypothetical protein [Desulfobacula sp.]
MYVIKNRGFALIFFCLVLGISGLSHADNVFFDDFNSNANEWLIEENNPNGLLSISNGFYYFANYVDSGSMMTIQEILIDQTRDFEVETQITKNGGDETLPYFGLTWTDNNTNNYLDFGIDGFGWFSIYMVVDGTGTNIVEWTESPYLNQGIGGINKLSIKKTDNTIEFYINDNVVHSMAAVTLAGDHIGFFIDGAQDIAIDYLYVTQDGSSNSSATCETVPGAVSLTAPTGTTTDTSPTLTWNSDSCATWYKVYLVNTATDYKFVQWYEIENNFTNYPEATCSGGTCSVTPGVTLASGNYEWWVRTWNENGNGAWSSTGSFTVQGDDTLPAKIYLTSPSGNINGLGTTFTWNQDADATWYKLYLASSTGYKFVQW